MSGPAPSKIRITGSARMVAEAIRDGHTWGLAIIKQTGMHQAVVYSTLRRWREAGWVTCENETMEAAAAANRPPRRVYELTSTAIDALGWHDL
ncbi:DNA-binding PadR family transcriptional regulator [Actinoplanes lutulentus]|uniref:PadR family transcriptional regulator n=1 Tax=Actinoplanes lutulentus TaxID=1287878 RepID=A0A327Z0M3_9ACTN|nr:helix-turn-helix transcriptional regulator [Actinoplanes lutulentus]MBB2940497.1 DNA-binding PadR family transcriptional regulator [Actinoplanes lutulentus]RAK25479.1 PadR family transcriptional regulator [Actinoplanes lutulentus]